jgi:hypothetical protein
MDSALVGLVGLLVGILLTEVLRRRTRIELYSPRVFDKRLAVYEELYQMVQGLDDALSGCMADDLRAEERQALASKAVLDLAAFCDKNALYLNEEVTIHCVSALMGAEGIAGLKSVKQREEEVTRIRKKIREGLEIIKQESGIRELDRLFRSIARPKYTSDVIEYYRSLKKEID